MINKREAAINILSSIDRVFFLTLDDIALILTILSQLSLKELRKVKLNINTYLIKDSVNTIGSIIEFIKNVSEHEKSLRKGEIRE